MASLGDLLIPHGELLPLRTRFGRFLAYNVTKVADVLDEHRCGLRYAKDGVTAVYVHRWEFVPELVGRLAIFRLPQKPSTLLVTDRFVTRVEQTGLSGFVFTPLWVG